MKLARASRPYAEFCPILSAGADREAFDRTLDGLCARVAGTTWVSYEETVQAPRTHADRPLCADLRDPRMDIRIYGIDDIQYTDARMSIVESIETQE